MPMAIVCLPLPPSDASTTLPLPLFARALNPAPLQVKPNLYNTRAAPRGHWRIRYSATICDFASAAERRYCQRDGGLLETTTARIGAFLEPYFVAASSAATN
ncbi:hypothetical protein GY45DRAFT_1364933 [Cubamyces sp. BRFM 1775]|nr:hypothetical protein GY45DRAFT_1364933 [Cubamyces sp. BRFM 1775]